MGELIVALLPLALGILLSPLAYMALVAVLLSRIPRANGIAFLAGWAIGLVGVLALSIWIFGLLGAQPPGEPARWVSIVHLVFGLFFLGAAVWVHRRGAERLRAMSEANTPREVVRAAAPRVSASPRLPGWLQAVDSFKPGRSGALGVAIFALNPVDASCAIVAGLDFVIAELPDAETVAIATGFAVIGILPIAVPVVYVLVRGAKAQPFLDATRTWIASHTGLLNAAFLLVIAVLQLQKGIAGLL
ncbi:GAP family protein [Agromyces italicus]|uniref:GAP family protein n=1 Tax=Agromyces italicus TaxID=279572 RepID=UPI0003B5BC47|nr:GAP family protein [Agromyces italicus]